MKGFQLPLAVTGGQGGRRSGLIAAKEKPGRERPAGLGMDADDAF